MNWKEFRDGLKGYATLDNIERANLRKAFEAGALDTTEAKALKAKASREPRVEPSAEELVMTDRQAKAEARAAARRPAKKAPPVPPLPPKGEAKS